jgi:hypothetical protein
MAGHRRIPHSVGFADSELSSYSREGDRLTVILQAWNEQPIGLVFDEVLAILDLAAWQIDDLRESDGRGSPLFEQALQRHFEQIPDQHAFRLFEFVDPSDTVVLAVVGTKVEAQ